VIAIGLNPGLVLLAGAVMVLVCTNALRMPIMLGTAIGAMALSFTNDFGSYARFAQIGLEITPLQLDPLAQVFGLGVGLAAIILVIASSTKRNRWRDGALLAASGGAAGAIFSGDLISFTAYMETASLAVVALVFCDGSAMARKASIQVLAWQACAGACLATGAGLIWGKTGQNIMGPMALDGPGPALILLGILVKAGAVPAHAWLRVCAGASRGIALAAILMSVPITALYALVRCFSDAHILLPIGAFLALYPALLSVGEKDRRIRLAFATASFIGLAMVGTVGGGPLGLAGACALAFALCLSGPLLALVIDVDSLAGPRTQLILRAIGVLGAASVLSVPGTLGYAATSLLLDGLARDGAQSFWLLGVVVTIVPVLGFGRGAAAEIVRDGRSEAAEPVAFGKLLAIGCAAFFVLVIGVDSRWLYALLPPGQLLYSPYDTPHLLARAQMLCAAGFAASTLWQIQRLIFSKTRQAKQRGSGDVFDWAVPCVRIAAGLIVAGAAWRARTRAAIERQALAVGKAGLNALEASETGAFREILGPGMVLVLAASLALGLLLNAG
jgi:formate hydrogenlyase subunit 3/multisubunit Na+/H+ antiporter MnhD subunit